MEGRTLLCVATVIWEPHVNSRVWGFKISDDVYISTDIPVWVECRKEEPCKD